MGLTDTKKPNVKLDDTNRSGLGITEADVQEWHLVTHQGRSEPLPLLDLYDRFKNVDYGKDEITPERMQELMGKYPWRIGGKR